MSLDSAKQVKTPAEQIAVPPHVRSPFRSALAVGTETRLDGKANERDTDTSQDAPLQMLATTHLRSVHPAPFNGDSAAWESLDAPCPSLILTLAESARKEASETHAFAHAVATETFKEGRGSGRDTDVELMATATETKVADPTARDKDIDQSLYAAIGSRRAR